MRLVALVTLGFVTLAPAALPSQRPDSLATEVRQYVVVDTAAVALTHVLLVDGTGAGPKPDQTIVIRDGRIAEVGPAGSVQRSEEHTSELQSLAYLVCRLLLEKKKKRNAKKKTSTIMKT